MAAKDNLHPKLFHGSMFGDLQPGERIINPNEDGGFVHGSDNPFWASMYGKVYEVEPWKENDLQNLGDTERIKMNEYASKSWRVVRRAPEHDLPEGHEFYEGANDPERKEHTLKALNKLNMRQE